MCKYHLNDQPIPSKSVVRYLGMYINSHLKWSDHVKHITAKASHSLNYLRHTLFASPSTVKSAAYNCLVIFIIYLLLISRTLQGYNADVQLHVYNFN